MNKEYLESQNSLYVTDESGPRKIPNSKNAIKIVKVDNEIELLTTELNCKETLLENLRKNTSSTSLILLIIMNIIYFLVIGNILNHLSSLNPIGLQELIKIGNPLEIALISSLSIGAPIITIMRFFKNKNQIGLLEIQISDLKAQIEAKEKEKEELEKEDAIEYVITNNRSRTQSLAKFNSEIRTSMIERLKLIRKLYKDKKTILALYEKGELMPYLTRLSYDEEEAKDILDLVSKSFTMQPKNSNETNN